jgi:hypothetical protein
MSKTFRFVTMSIPGRDENTPATWYVYDRVAGTSIVDAKDHEQAARIAGYMNEETIHSGRKARHRDLAGRHDG